MLVDVVQLRHRGTKPAAQRLKDAQPVRGRLVIETCPWRETWTPYFPNEPTTFAYLKNETEQRPLVPDRLPCLRNVRINRLRGAEMVIVGLERSGPDVREIDEPQAWWCRVVARA